MVESDHREPYGDIQRAISQGEGGGRFDSSFRTRGEGERNEGRGTSTWKSSCWSSWTRGCHSRPASRPAAAPRAVVAYSALGVGSVCPDLGGNGSAARGCITRVASAHGADGRTARSPAGENNSSCGDGGRLLALATGACAGWGSWRWGPDHERTASLLAGTKESTGELVGDGRTVQKIRVRGAAVSNRTCSEGCCAGEGARRV